MLGHLLHDRALGGERCWIRHEDGEVHPLPAHRWLGKRRDDEPFDEAVTQMCAAPTIELGCGPARLVARLIQHGIRARRRSGPRPRSRPPARRRPRPCSATCSSRCPEWVTGRRYCSSTATSASAATPRRILGRAAELLCRGGRCVAEFDTEAVGIRARWVRLRVGSRRRTLVPVGIGRCGQCRRAGRPAGTTLTGVRLVGGRVLADLAAL